MRGDEVTFEDFMGLPGPEECPMLARVDDLDLLERLLIFAMRRGKKEFAVKIRRRINKVAGITKYPTT